jgi:hypothetical protein
LHERLRRTGHEFLQTLTFGSKLERPALEIPEKFLETLQLQ